MQKVLRHWEVVVSEGPEGSQPYQSIHQRPARETGCDNKLHLVSLPGLGLCFSHLAWKIQPLPVYVIPHLVSPFSSAFYPRAWSVDFSGWTEVKCVSLNQNQKSWLSLASRQCAHTQPFHHGVFCLAFSWKTWVAPEVRPSMSYCHLAKGESHLSDLSDSQS